MVSRFLLPNICVAAASYWNELLQGLASIFERPKLEAYSGVLEPIFT